MNKTELIEVVSSKAEITKAEAGRVVNAVLDAVNEGLKADGKVVLPGFGTFEVRSRTARVGQIKGGSFAEVIAYGTAVKFRNE